MLVLGRHVWRDFEPAALDEGLAVVTFVGPTVARLFLFPRRLSIASAASRSAVPLACVISTSTISPLRFSMRMCPMWHRRDLSPALFLNSRASASVVLAWVSLQRSCPLKFTSGLRPGGVPLSSSFAFETLVRGPGLNQRAVHAEVFVAGKPAPLGAELDALEEGARQVFVEEAFAVGAEGGVVPDLVLDVQAHEPAVQQVVVDRLDQLAFAADGEQDLQQQGL